MNWTHPICLACYTKRHPDRIPARIKPEIAALEKCCDCGAPTNEGVYFRAHPKELKYPAMEEE